MKIDMLIGISAPSWRPGSLAFMVDGEVVHRLDQSPDYLMQLMLGVFEFPLKVGDSGQRIAVPELVVSGVYRLAIDRVS